MHGRSHDDVWIDDDDDDDDDDDYNADYDDDDDECTTQVLSFLLPEFLLSFQTCHLCPLCAAALLATFA